VGVLVVLLPLAGFLAAKPILFIEGGSRKADAIIVLGGGVGDRAFRAIELYRAGAAPSILVTGAGDYYQIKTQLVLAGVPDNSIFLEKQARNTKENAEFSARWLREHNAKTAILITSWFHARRALASFHHFGSDMEFSSYPAYHGVSMEGKPSWREAPSVLREYPAMAWYLVRYGIFPAAPIPRR
jgi:uncharacterized SAM-binding protein YcdF (DUF218 family)